MAKSDASSGRKATSVSLDVGLVEQARELDINISRACERGLAEQIAEARAEHWQLDNADAIASWNEYIDRNGLPLSEFRQF